MKVTENKIIVAIGILAFVFILIYINRSSYEKQKRFIESANQGAFTGFLQNNHVPLLKVNWLKQGTPDPEAVRLYCLLLDLPFEPVWDKLNDLENYELVYKGDPLDLDVLRQLEE